MKFGRKKIFGKSCMSNRKVKKNFTGKVKKEKNFTGKFSNKSPKG